MINYRVVYTRVCCLCSINTPEIDAQKFRNICFWTRAHALKCSLKAFHTTIRSKLLDLVHTRNTCSFTPHNTPLTHMRDMYISANNICHLMLMTHRACSRAFEAALEWLFTSYLNGRANIARILLLPLRRPYVCADTNTPLCVVCTPQPYHLQGAHVKWWCHMILERAHATIEQH